MTVDVGDVVVEDPSALTLLCLPVAAAGACLYRLGAVMR